MDDSIDYQAKLEKLEKIEEQNRIRARKYLQRRKENGKMQISAIIQRDTHEEINRRKTIALDCENAINAGDIIEQAINFSKEFVKDNGSLDFELLEKMIKTYQEQLQHTNEDTDININDNTNNNTTKNNDKNINNTINVDVFDNTNDNSNANCADCIKEDDSINITVNIDNNTKGINTQPAKELAFEDDSEKAPREIEISDDEAEESLKVLEEMTQTQSTSKNITPPDQYPNRQDEIFHDDTSESKGMKYSISKEDMPDREKDSEGYEDWLFQKITHMKGRSIKMTAIEKQFNEDGILTIRGKTWCKGSVYMFMKNYNKKIKNDDRNHSISPMSFNFNVTGSKC
ncbi:hypothetical protein MTBBW1_2760004 [Desulfamplus magnetovallimortis]|uniref:Uncharacterized protein n=1 Tax=Desulfamplus magnetovallimortis TaxID=1246637 RepID=A0A1W1HFE3_9BACT|nr:hypothetical protein [Desulfamplus magnetovallimortis]SLM31156.1 hypothetical protein MTBBW1_2760004 [Desulfamplus magnetovallimortis]